MSRDYQNSVRQVRNCQSQASAGQWNLAARTSQRELVLVGTYEKFQIRQAVSEATNCK